MRRGVSKVGAFMIATLFALGFVAAAPSAAVDIAPWYPKGSEYVFICKLTDFNATVYDWDFGDGQKLYDIGNNNVFHRFAANGTYDVTCDGENAQGEVIGTRQVTVGTAPPIPQSTGNVSATLGIAAWYPKGNDYVFTCTANGFTATDYDWDFGDGEKLIDMKRSDVFHRFAKNGSYTVSCEAEAPGRHADDWMTVKVQ